MIDWTKPWREIIAENPGYVFEGEEAERMQEKIRSEKILYYTNAISEKISEGDIQRAAELIEYSGNDNHLSQYLLSLFVDRFNDPVVLFDLIIGVYTNDGYSFPKKMIQLAKRLAPLVPEDHRLQGLPTENTITVWRGTYIINPDCGRLLRPCVSWTTDKTMAIWFANRINSPYSKNGKGGVWEATIPRKKIIAFTQARNESEVLQHMNVHNPRILDISADEWETSLQYQLEQREKNHQELLNSL